MNGDVENAGVETSARFCRGGKCGSGNTGKWTNMESGDWQSM